jgi:EmrB/QacA subfamily drug resistance transporter
MDNPHHDRRWLVLAVLGIAQLMVVLDATVVNIALPSAQRSLGFSNADRQWVVTAYALAFGSLLLLGGRISDLFGRKWTFIGGLIGFAVASAAGGAAGSFGVLISARAVQGVFGAVLAPASLSLLATTFTDPDERGKAFGIFGALAGSGAAVGLLLGGVLTQYLSWRWCLYVNLIFAGVGIAGAMVLLHNVRPQHRPKLDIVGTVLAFGGLAALVYGFSHASTTSWGNTLTVVMLAISVVLLTAFVVLERRVPNPLLPLRIVLDRDRGGSYLSVALSAIAIFAAFLFLTYYLQQNLRLSPVMSGVAFMPMVGGIMISSIFGNVRLVPRFGARPLVPTGMAAGCAGMLYLTSLGPHSSYAAHILPATIVMGFGFGLIFAPAIATAISGVADADSGAASAMVNVSQQVGGSVGTALLSTIAVTATRSFLRSHHGGSGVATQAAVHGYTTAFTWAAIIFAVGAVVTALVLRPHSARQAAAAEAAGPGAAAAPLAPGVDGTEQASERVLG